MAAGYVIIFTICTFHLQLLAVESSDDVTTRVESNGNLKYVLSRNLLNTKGTQ